VFGGSGHAKVIIDAIERQTAYEIAFLVDDDEHLRGRNVYGYRVMGGREDLVTSGSSLGVTQGIVAIGNNQARRAVAGWLANRGFGFITAVHPAAIIGRGVTVGEGTVVMAGVVVNADTSLGEHAIINTGATVDHDCRVDAFAHIGPGSHLCGGVTVGRDTFICAGVTVVPNIRIGHTVIVGAGSTVLHDLPDDVTAVGTPARILTRKS